MAEVAKSCPAIVAGAEGLYKSLCSDEQAMEAVMLEKRVGGWGLTDSIGWIHDWVKSLRSGRK